LKPNIFALSDGKLKTTFYFKTNNPTRISFLVIVIIQTIPIDVNKKYDS